jgi:hypothetical protein
MNEENTMLCVLMLSEEGSCLASNFKLRYVFWSRSEGKYVQGTISL